MTEQDWMNGTDPTPMLEFLRTNGKATDSKLRLFAVACCRQVWHSLTDEPSRKTVEIAEQFADGLASLSDLQGACDDTWDHVDWGNAPVMSADRAAACAAEPISGAFAARDILTCSGVLVDPCGLLRDIIGNPFRPINFDPDWPSWHDGLLVLMAQRMYDSRDFSDMPVLADAMICSGVWVRQYRSDRKDTPGLPVEQTTRTGS